MSNGAEKKPETGTGVSKPAAADADASKASGTPARSPHWRDVWQLPALGVAAVLLIGGVATVIARRPKPDIAAMLHEASSLIEEQKFELALDELNSKILPYFDKPVMDADQRREFHVLVARGFRVDLGCGGVTNSTGG